MTLPCPRCRAPLAPAPDVGEGVLLCRCGVFFVERVARQRLLSFLRVAEETWTVLVAEGRRGPACACGATMATLTLKGVPVDGCAACGGLLLDPGELRALTGLNEPAPVAPAPVVAAAVPVTRNDPALGRTYLPARDALRGFLDDAGAVRLQQVKSQVGGEVLGLPVNQPFQWTLQAGLATGSIGPDDDSAARQLLAFVTGNWISSRFLLRDGRDNPVLLLVRKTRALVFAQLEVRFADDESLLGEVSRGAAGFSLEAKDARGARVLRFEKHLGDLWGFTVVDDSGAPVGDVLRRLDSLELDVSLIGGLDLDRSLRRDDYELVFTGSLALSHKALALAALFLAAHATSGGPLTGLYP